MYRALRFCGGVHGLVSSESGVGGAVTVSSNGKGCQTVNDVTESEGALPARAAYCYAPSAITLSSQSDVDNFQQNYGPSCDTMMYGIRIDGGNDFNNWRISNLDGLSGLKSIQGDLDIYGNYFLADVTGLSDLERIEGALKLERNALSSRVQRLEISLPKLSYASSIELVSSGSDFKLGSFSADALASLPGDLRIGAQNLDALSLLALEEVGGDLVITVTRLSNLSGLNDLKLVGGKIEITSNTDLKEIDGLQGLTSTNRLMVSSNGGLQNIDGLSRVTTIDGDLFIQSNSALRNLDGFVNKFY